MPQMGVLDINVICIRGSNSIDLMTDDGVRLVDIQGLGAISTISTSAVNGSDGETITSNVLPKRAISIILRFRPGDVEAARYKIYDIFRLKQNGTMKLISKYRTAKIEYIVEKVEIPPNVYPMRAQISLICPDPYFEALDEVVTEMSDLISKFRLPFHIPVGPFKISEKSNSYFKTVTNNSDGYSGADFVFYAASAVVNPYIENVNTGEKMGLNMTMQADDTVVIKTQRGQKRMTLIRGETEINVSNYKIRPFTFLQLAPGENLLKRGAESNVSGLYVSIYTKIKWGAF